jgi:hypothetical protein
MKRERVLVVVAADVFVHVRLSLPAFCFHSPFLCRKNERERESRDDDKRKKHVKASDTHLIIRTHSGQSVTDRDTT